MGRVSVVATGTVRYLGQSKVLTYYRETDILHYDRIHLVVTISYYDTLNPCLGLQSLNEIKPDGKALNASDSNVMIMAKE